MSEWGQLRMHRFNQLLVTPFLFEEGTPGCSAFMSVPECFFLSWMIKLASAESRPVLTFLISQFLGEDFSRAVPPISQRPVVAHTFCACLLFWGVAA